MSKVVKAVGRAISGVVKGVVNVVKGVVSGVKKIATSKVGKILLAAATVYFGGAAIMGAMGGASAGTGFLGTLSGAVSGASAGISSAWTGLTGALTGGGLSSLGSGFTGAYGAGSSAVTGAAALAAPTNVLAGGSVVSGAAPAVNSGAVLGAAVPTAPAVSSSGGLISGAWNGLGEYGKMAAVQGASNMVGGVIQGYGQQKALEEQRNFETEQARLARERYNQNAGARLWGAVPEDTTGGAYAREVTSTQDPVADSRLLADRYSGMQATPYGVQPAGLVGSRIQPMASNNFPVYNPYYYRG